MESFIYGSIDCINRFSFCDGIGFLRYCIFHFGSFVRNDPNSEEWPKMAESATDRRKSAEGLLELVIPGP